MVETNALFNFNIESFQATTWSFLLIVNTNSGVTVYPVEAEVERKYYD